MVLLELVVPLYHILYPLSIDQSGEYQVVEDTDVRWVHFMQLLQDHNGVDKSRLYHHYDSDIEQVSGGERISLE